MKCKWCTFRSSSKRDMAIHIKNNHRSKLPASVTSHPSFDDSTSFIDIPDLDFSDFIADDKTESFSGGGGDFDGGGSSDDY